MEDYTIRIQDKDISFSGVSLGVQKVRSGERYEVFELNDGRYLLLYDNGKDHGFFDTVEGAIRSLWVCNRLYLPSKLIQILGGLTDCPESYKSPKRSIWKRITGNYERTPEEKALRNIERRDNMIYDSYDL